MDPVTASLHAAYQLLRFSVDVDHAPSQVRQSLELVQTCYRDLQHLIEIRNECLPFLRQTPIVLNRVNDIIETAGQGLVEVCSIVEKRRPDTNKGKMPLRDRMAWLLFDSVEFRGHEPTISRHHASVLAEMTFLRHAALLAPQIQQQKQQQQRKPDEAGEIKGGSEIFHNVALLGGLMSQMAFTANPSHQPSSPLFEEAISTSQLSNDAKSPETYQSYNPPCQINPRSSNITVGFPAVPHESFCELEAPFDPSLRSSTPPLTPSSPPPPFQILYVNQARSQPGITTVQPSSDLGSLSLLNGNQMQYSLPEPAPWPHTPGLLASKRLSDDGFTRQIIPSSPSILSLCSNNDTSSLLSVSEQPSEPGIPPQTTFKQRFSGHFRQMKRASPRFLAPDDEGPSAGSIRSRRLPSELFSAPEPFRSNTDSSPADSSGRWFSPDSVHAWPASPSPNLSTATLDSEAPTLTSPSPTMTTLHSIPALSLGRDTGGDVFHFDDDFDRIKSGYYRPAHAYPEPTAPAPRADSNAKLQTALKPADRPALPGLLPPRSLADSALVFGSAFWGPDAGQGLLPDPDPAPEAARTGFLGDRQGRDTIHGIGSVPGYSGVKRSRHARSYADQA
ncbi:hypothetical protein CDEST_00894 [Colletotrichum destructivum]|uniref:Uncharacterized protein n=1 Tax=Colletotrichum destructivum TaxID=34406 RepID=A0AAX4HXN9_9PEZI|nr:hypothetical protein CDEST_00894 [Colletotrichum destructivum]